MAKRNIKRRRRRSRRRKRSVSKRRTLPPNMTKYAKRAIRMTANCVRDSIHKILLKFTRARSKSKKRERRKRRQ